VIGWFLHTFGIDTTTGYWYAFWSGFGSDISELALLAGIFAWYHKHNCHQLRCWRIGRHLVDGTPWCNHHHRAARNL
jgi:hypothetical protein